MWRAELLATIKIHIVGVCTSQAQAAARGRNEKLGPTGRGLPRPPN
jgi:hypothetical protein